MQINTVNPANGQALMTYTAHTDDEVEKMVDAADIAFRQWRQVSVEERAKYLDKIADQLDLRRSELANLMAEEMGKILSEGKSEIDKCAWVCRYYAQRAAEFLKDEALDSDADESFASFEPLGVLLAVMPWNFPFWQVFRCAAPAIAAGNACVLKHAGNVSACALEIEKIFQNAGLPNSLFTTLLVNSDQIQKVIENEKVKAVTLTGSTAAGKAVAEIAGSELKKVVLELGGSDPYIVLEDADLNAAAQACVESRLVNCGQSCIAAKRFIVLDSIKDTFENLIVEKMRKKAYGNPLDGNSEIGPMAREDLRDELDSQVQACVDAGAKLLLGGIIPKGSGAFYPPTVLSDVASGMPAYDDELFGPVASIISVKTHEEAVAVANDSVFGLGSAVFTQDLDLGREIARKIEAGNCAINDFVRSDPRLPFGGIKQSGHGRELSHYGIKEFVNIKTITVSKNN